MSTTLPQHILTAVSRGERSAASIWIDQASPRHRRGSASLPAVERELARLRDTGAIVERDGLFGAVT